ncbi:MAG: glutamine amidotransferase [Hydrogenophaga sp.]
MPEQLPILVVKTGSTHQAIRARWGDFEDWIARGLQSGGAQVRVHDAVHAGVPPVTDDLAGVVITGSHAMVSEREPWSEALVPWLRAAVRQRTPVLGICYGHQLLAHALGGEVDHHPEGVEIGTVTVALQPHAASDPLLGGLPATFPAQAVHWQSVRRLPPGALLLAGSAHEPHHAFRVGDRAWGVQFHPEFSDAALRAYLDGLGDRLAREGRDAAGIAARLQPTPDAASVLPRFARLALSENRSTATSAPRA